MRTCFSRVRSALTKYGMPDGGKVIVIPRFRPSGAIMAWHSRRTSVREVGCIDSTRLPASIWERSTISLISSSRYHPDRRICSTLAVWASVGGGVSESMSWAKPRIVLSGARRSWLMQVRKSDFARLAFSASALASSISWLFSCSARSRRFSSVTSRAVRNTP